MIGAKLGPYEIVAAIGAGGMGEVYRARDTRLGRDVALKVLPEAVARDAERMARMRREAQVLASLNHPNIAAIYGFEDSENTYALVMELVEGPTLAEKIFGTTKGSVAAGFSPASGGKSGATGSGSRAGLALDEALPLAKQICEAIEYAHERGIIHRDLKPSNVKVTHDGQVKVLDFGLAKAIEGDAETATIDNSPTLSAMATHAGFLLGTAAYMSPEQARGKKADRRADIWAFGVVLYEMLSGKRLFTGETTSDTLAAVIRAEPDWNELPAATPPKIRELLQRCLKKDPRQRLQSIGDARITLEEYLMNPNAADVGATLGSPWAGQAPPLQSDWRRFLPWATGAVAIIIAALFAIGYFLLRAPQPASAVVAQILPPATASFAFEGDLAGPPVISPDGKSLAFTATGSDGNRLWVRSLDAPAAHALEGADNAAFPFWSADNHSIGYFANGKLNRIDASGGPPLAIADASTPRGGTWSADGTILFTPTTTSPIYRVPASGGPPQAVTKLNASRQEITHRWPQFLPDGKHFLFYAHCNDPQNNATYAASLDGGAPKLLIRGNSNALYAAPGYLLFVLQGTLMAEPFDVASLRLTGNAMPLAEPAGVNDIIWRGIFSSSENGILAYEAGSTALPRIGWFDRSGKQLATRATAGDLTNPRISPDGRKLAYSLNVQGTSIRSIRIFDLARGVDTRLTFSSSIDRNPAWSPDGKMIAFASVRSGQLHIYRQAADGTGTAVPLVVDDASESNPSFSSDGRYLIFERLAAQPGSRIEIWALPLFGDRKAFPVVQGQQYDISDPSLSSDNKWLAYTSLESGQAEVYVVPFGPGSGKWQISTTGGYWPRWRHDGKELFYMSPDSKIMSAQISEVGSSLVIGKVTPLFQANIAFSTYGSGYDVSADGKRFVAVSHEGTASPSPLTLVTNWPALLKKQ